MNKKIVQEILSNILAESQFYLGDKPAGEDLVIEIILTHQNRVLFAPLTDAMDHIECGDDCIKVSTINHSIEYVPYCSILSIAFRFDE